ncbi:hypothetical protein D3C86_1577000 [compost metagenome]
MRAMRQTKTHRDCQVRCHFQQYFTLGQRFADQAELVMFQVAQAAMDQFGAGGRCRTGEIVGFQHQYR